MAEVLDDVERDRNMKSSQDPCRPLRVHARHHGVELAVHEVNTRLDRRTARRQPRITRRERDHGAGDAGSLHRLERHRPALREADQHGAARGHAEVGLLAPYQVLDVGQQDRKSTRLNSSHRSISNAVFCLKKKKKPSHTQTYSDKTNTNKRIIEIKERL